MDITSFILGFKKGKASGSSGGGAQTTEFIPTTTFTNDYYSDFGVFVYFIPLEAEMMAAWVENRKTVTVVYDNEEYNVTPQLLTGADGSDGVCVGDLSVFGGTGNNEPFAVVPWNIDGVDGLLIGSTVDTAPTEHTIRIYQEASVSMEGVYTVTFMSEDGSSVLYERLVVDGDDCANVVDRGLLAAPTKASTVQYNYTYSGWSLTPGGAADASALSSVTADRTVYAAFTSAIRYYTITYYDGDTVLKTESLPYGAMPSYTPEKDGVSFVEWTPSLATVTGNASYTAVWQEKVTFAGGTWADIAAISENGRAADYFAIGDTRSITFGTKTLTFKLAAFDHDTLSDGTGKAGMTIIACDLDNRKDTVNATSTNTGGYPASDVKTYLEETIFPSAPEELKAVIKSVQKEYNAGKSTTISVCDCKLWLLSNGEIGVTKNSYGENLEYGDKYPNFDPKLGKTTDISYWLRNAATKSAYWLRYNSSSDAIASTPANGSGYSPQPYLLYGFCI